MTAATTPGGRSENPALMWAGHYAVWIGTFTCLPLLAAYALTGQPGGWILRESDTLVWFAWFGIVALDAGYHDARLCERCARETPLDPQGAVDRWRWALRANHFRKRTYLIILAVILGAVLLVQVIFYSTATWEARVFTLVLILAMGVFDLVQLKHRRLNPWCPWCHWDDGGDEEAVPDVPAPSESVH
jgi:hypothetical protein